MVEENGIKYRWDIPVHGEGEKGGSYLLESLMNIEIGEEIRVEMKKSGMKNYVEVVSRGEIDEVPEETAEEVEAQITEEK